MKSLIKNLSLAILSSSLFLAYAPMADEKKARVVKHKIIQAHAGTDGQHTPQIIMLEGDELSDDAALEEKLAELEPEIRDKVLSLLEDIDPELHSGDDDSVIKKSIVKILKRDAESGEIVDISADGHDVDLSILNLSDVIGNHVDLNTTVIKMRGNQTEAAIQMIKQGDFTQNELDQIQVALDEKR